MKVKPTLIPSPTVAYREKSFEKATSIEAVQCPHVLTDSTHTLLGLTLSL